MAYKLDDDFWSERYTSNQTGWDIGAASPAITDFIDAYPNKKAHILIPGCGNAYEAFYLVEQGFEHITLLDISEVLVKSLRTTLTHPAVTIIHGDFFDQKDQYDLILEQTFFCALDPALRPAYTRKMYELLKPGGMLAGLLFNRSFEGGPPFGGKVEEYQSLFEVTFPSVNLSPCQKSIPPRAGNEVWMELKKSY